MKTPSLYNRYCQAVDKWKYYTAIGRTEEAASAQIKMRQAWAELCAKQQEMASH